ncbi:TRAF-like signal transducer [Aspergillus rambellii]|uniref:TRAF-like signal transducer n=1 Tax=Aspergillus rambellii TaxID=308745 RepID=A0A0F8UP41_9EURO|nr:TRAF-like signal transducer [Aspergillus rambellii]
MKLDQFLAMEALEQDELIDLRALEYVGDYDDHLMCPICHCPFIRPVRLECDHVFCQMCLNTAIRSFISGRDEFTCPTCRTPTRDVYLNVPRLLINMCDEIPTRCPYASEGCKEIVPRGHIQSHADKYCGYKPMDCPVTSCDMTTRRKDLSPERKCLHGLHKCLRCDEDIMEQEYEEHVKELCPSLKTTCPDCQVTVFRKALREHIDACPEAIHPCAASKYGCPVKMKRAELGTHEQSCPLITIGPYFEAQNSRLDSLELTMRHLQQRNEIFEDGLANIRSTLIESSHALSSHNPDITSTDPSSNSNSTTPGISSNNDQAQIDGSSNSFANATTYLLSLHESLREEVAQLSHAITDLDARASMAIMNECLRIKEDMAHTNAAVSSIRMQVQWLMNPRLHQGQRASNTNHSNDTRAAAATAPSSRGQLGSSTPGPSNGPGLFRPRRLSDTGREGTKL